MPLQQKTRLGFLLKGSNSGDFGCYKPPRHHFPPLEIALSKHLGYRPMKTKANKKKRGR